MTILYIILACLITELVFKPRIAKVNVNGITIYFIALGRYNRQVYVIIKDG